MLSRIHLLPFRIQAYPARVLPHRVMIIDTVRSICFPIDCGDKRWAIPQLLSRKDA